MLCTLTRTGLSLALTLAVATAGHTANHREAPLTALDPKADITDFYAFVSYDDSGKVTFILDVDPLLEPSNGPNYFPFDPEIVYAIRIDNNHDAVADLSFEFRFTTEIRAPSVFTGFVGAGSGITAPSNSPAPVAPGTPLIPPAITALDGTGSEGLSLRQRYTVTLVQGRQQTTLAEGLIAVPTNVGPRTMPDYAGLTEQGVYHLDNGVRVFAGTVDDPFWIDLGAAFDSLNFRPGAFNTGIPGVLGDDQDEGNRSDTTNFASDDVAGFNVNAIAIEAPITLLTADGHFHTAGEPLATIGAWGATLRPRSKAYRRPGESPKLSPRLTQIQRMGNPLFNELLIGTGDKDKFSMSQPKDDAQFADYALDPLLARVLNAIYAEALPIPDPPRTDLLPLVTYAPPIAASGTPTGPVADLLRLNTGVPPTPAVQRKRLGLLAGDPAGFPNGRRLSDDVTDIAARAVVGVLTGDSRFTGFPHNRIGDGVNVNDVPYRESFPYLGLAHSGRDSRHVDPGELGCESVCPLD
ncbi:MAG: DUF4331 domain-containing protein [Candidatus Competibacteraceae bacterium]|nr:DUF4331 domain-containing protein [Candidatus Competibacteraceae bacterium]MCP5126700.1 DUF4331 domain-containing protein [Gammaproteobacteria bacterium]HRX71747.1 DUF4331 domain-containing protein [Candidatus Competibacteraceae bacterium]